MQFHQNEGFLPVYSLKSAFTWKPSQAPMPVREKDHEQDHPSKQHDAWRLALLQQSPIAWRQPSHGESYMLGNGKSSIWKIF